MTVIFKYLLPYQPPRSWNLRVPGGLYVLDHTCLSVAVPSVFRSERARWITALGRSSGKRPEDRTCEYRPGARL